MVIRLDEDGNAITQGTQIEIGGNDRYVSMCRKHFKENYYPADTRATTSAAAVSHRRG